MVRTDVATRRVGQSDPSFRFLASTLASAFARSGYYMSSAWILVERGYGTGSVATLLAIVSVVECIASPLVGGIADRFDRRRLNIAADLCRFVVTLATGCALLLTNAFLALCLSVVLFALCDRASLTASQAMIPALARGRKIIASNSIFFFVMQIGNLGAALLVGPLLEDRSPALPFTVLAIFFLVSAASMVLVRLDPVPCEIPVVHFPIGQIDPNLVRLIAVYAFLYGSAVLVSVMGSSFVFQEQKGTAVDFGYLEAAWSAGSLFGAVSLARTRRTMSTDMLHLMLLGSTALVLMALSSAHMPWTVILFAALGFLYNLGRVSVEVTLQSQVPASLLGRAKGVMHSVALVLALIVFGTAAAAADRVFPSTVFFSFGVMLLIGISGLRAALVQREEKSEN